jgi:hypothetical protein
MGTATLENQQTIASIANRLVELCRQHAYEQAAKELYSPEMVSIEVNAEGFNQPKVAKGMAELIAKTEQWNAEFEIKSGIVSDPLLSANEFAVQFTMEALHKPSGQMMPMSEIAVYEVADGKIIKESFFYSALKGQ